MIRVIRLVKIAVNKNYGTQLTIHHFILMAPTAIIWCFLRHYYYIIIYDIIFFFFFFLLWQTFPGNMLCVWT